MLLWVGLKPLFIDSLRAGIPVTASRKKTFSHCAGSILADHYRTMVFQRPGGRHSPMVCNFDPNLR